MKPQFSGYFDGTGWVSTGTSVTTVSTSGTGYVYVMRPLKVFPDHLCCLRWAKAYRDLVRSASGWGSLADDWDSPEDHAAYDDCNCGRRAFECDA